MKKVYLAPQTEAIKLLGENAIMAGSVTPGGNPLGDMLYGGNGGAFGGD